MTELSVSRRQARRDAMVILYQRDITGAPLVELYASLEHDTGHSPDRFTILEVEGVTSGARQLDAAIDAASEGWPAHRMAALERNILRLALYEMREIEDIPIEVSIDEAVALSKRFCSREAATLVNGILGKIAEEGRSQ